MKGLFSSGPPADKGHINQLLFQWVKQIVWVEAGSMFGAKTRHIWAHHQSHNNFFSCFFKKCQQMEVSNYCLDFNPHLLPDPPLRQQIIEWMQLLRFRIRGERSVIWVMDFLHRGAAAPTIADNHMMDGVKVNYTVKWLFYCLSHWRGTETRDKFRQFWALK